MHLRNSTQWPNKFIKKVVSFCCRHLKVPVGFIDRLKVRNRNSKDDGTSVVYSGHCYHYSTGCEICVSITNDEDDFPCPTRDGLILQDRVEALVMVMAHEIRHAQAELTGEKSRGSGQRIGSSERQTERDTREVMAIFLKDKEQYLAEWMPAEPVKVQLSRAEKNELKAKAFLSKWQRKLSLAKNKVKRYRAAVARYEKKKNKV